MIVQQYFNGKGCVVTGAASGIGYAVSEELLKAGAVVFMADRDKETLASSVKQLGSYEGQVHSMEVDVTKEEQVRKMLEDAASICPLGY